MAQGTEAIVVISNFCYFVLITKCYLLYFKAFGFVYEKREGTEIFWSQTNFNFDYTWKYVVVWTWAK